MHFVNGNGRVVIYRVTFPSLLPCFSIDVSLWDDHVFHPSTKSLLATKSILLPFLSLLYPGSCVSFLCRLFFLDLLNRSYFAKNEFRQNWGFSGVKWKPILCERAIMWDWKLVYRAFILFRQYLCYFVSLDRSLSVRWFEELQIFSMCKSLTGQSSQCRGKRNAEPILPSVQFNFNQEAFDQEARRVLFFALQQLFWADYFSQKWVWEALPRGRSSDFGSCYFLLCPIVLTCSSTITMIRYFQFSWNGFTFSTLLGSIKIHDGSSCPKSLVHFIHRHIVYA